MGHDLMGANDGPAMLWRLGRGLRAFADEDYVMACAALRASMPRLSAVGGSGAQHQLFQRITEVAAARS